MSQQEASGMPNAATRLRTLAAPIAGLSFLWPLLHASPYYPLALAPALMEQGVAVVSGYHMFYSAALILFSALVLALCRDAHAPSIPLRPVALGAGATAFVGGLMIALTDALGAVSGAATGIAITLLACSVVALLALWFAVFASLALDDVFLAASLSYAASSAIWMLLQVAAPALVVPFVVLCPGISAACLMACLPMDAQAQASVDGLRVLRWGIIGYCLALSWLAAICVRALTTMELGATLVGEMASLRGIMTSACSLAICAIGAVYCWKVRSRVSFLVVMVAFLSLVAVGSLMVVVLTNSQGLPSLLGKRMFISAEHCLDVAVFAIFAHGAARHRLSPLALAAAYGVAACAIPQLLSLDLMYQAGALGTMESVDLVIPIAALLSFAVTAVIVVGLMSYVSNVTRDINEQSGNWERSLCEKATAAVGLTPRELEVVELTYRGYTAKSIARELLVSESTVKAHLAHAYRKLDVHTKQALIEHIDAYRGM